MSGVNYGRRAWQMKSGARSKRRPAPKCRHHWVRSVGLNLRPVIACRRCRRIKRRGD